MSHMGERKIIEADLTWTGQRFERGVRVVVEPDGRIGEVIGAGHSESPDVAEAPRVELPGAGRALLPGFVNAHSHAFQRGLRGLGERYAVRPGSFWTWRQTMYDLVDRMDAATFERLTREAFSEMLAAGITTVGEFHYLHHDSGGKGYAFDEIVIEAAAAVGIRLVLLGTCYRTGGIDEPLAGAQLRFGSPSLEAYWAQMDRLASRLDPATQTLGVAAHSIRAVAPQEIAALHQESIRRHLVFHMHVEEQTREIEQCVAAYGKPPMAVLNERLEIDPRFTAVHCTHTATADLEAFLASGGNVCICPLTEAALGDGIADVRGIFKRYGSLCLGTDSNARICLVEEMRWLEYGQRLATRSRGVCTDESGRVAPALLRAATLCGARALGLRAGAIRPGHLADFVAIDLDCPSLAGWTEETLLESLVLGCGNEAIAGVWVGGKWKGRDEGGGTRDA